VHLDRGINMKFSILNIVIKDEIVCPLDTAILTLQLSIQINKAERTLK
jgi:hypothetical protein